MARDDDQASLSDRPTPTWPSPARPLVQLVSADDELVASVELAIDGLVALQTLSDEAGALAKCFATRPALLIWDQDSSGFDAPQLVALLQRVLGANAPHLVLVAPREGVPAVAAVAKKPVDPYELERIVCDLLGIGTRTPVTAGAGAERQAGLDPGAVARMLHEALGRVTCGSRVEYVITTALGQADLDAIPSDVDVFASVLVPSLQAVVSDSLGEDAAEAVLLDLAPLMDSAEPSSGVRLRAVLPPPSSKGDAGTDPVALLACGGPLVGAVHEALEGMGFYVEMAADGHRALDRCHLAMPDVVIADADLPGLGGAQLVSLLRFNLESLAPPVVLLARSADDAADCGADVVLHGSPDAGNVAATAARLVAGRDPRRRS